MNDLVIVTQDDGQRTDEEQFVTMRVDGQTFGVLILMVQDIGEARQINPVPLSSAAISGVMNLRDQIIAMDYLHKYIGV